MGAESHMPYRTSHPHGSPADTGDTACRPPPGPSDAVGHPPCILAPSLAAHKCISDLHTFHGTSYRLLGTRYGRNRIRTLKGDG